MKYLGYILLLAVVMCITSVLFSIVTLISILLNFLIKSNYLDIINEFLSLIVIGSGIASVSLFLIFVVLMFIALLLFSRSFK